ncbi:MAG: hypothetical protein K9L17_05850 [Clostridiales bacterium]|nr:hypothetical protein [Clostridiales bacterium]MCF8022195.1 hypothetical protein [Clostridiales bacterium]
MSRKDRKELIRQIEELRGSRLICYITGDRENLKTRIAPDVNHVFYRHLEMISKKMPVDLFLYTRGGDILTPWRLVCLIREYTPDFNVLVPFRSYSAGTLICLGASNIIMGKWGELGPIDPSVDNPFNPEDPNDKSAKISIDIENVYSFISLVTQKAGIVNQVELSKIIRMLAEKIHPLALGNVYRYHLLTFHPGSPLPERSEGRDSVCRNRIFLTGTE